MQKLTGCRTCTCVLTGGRSAAYRTCTNPAGGHIAEQQPVRAPWAATTATTKQTHAEAASRRGYLQHRHRPPMLQQECSHLFVESPQLLPVLQRGGLAGALPQNEVLERLQLETPPEDALQTKHASDVNGVQTQPDQHETFRRATDSLQHCHFGSAQWPAAGLRTCWSAGSM